ncbi:MAG TPA: TetR/AcrR family transcriptional regulator [Solirubrobacteraceae bacterium]|nr:TetR/AcrR family transcriptional regulator [Solirubrobacteraceae bacterium]
MSADHDDLNTADRILDTAEALAQTRGFNGFSYAHIAAELGITKASLHYHFRGKAELGGALIARYSERFADALRAIDADGGDARDKLNAYAALYSGVLDGGRMCLCGMLAAEYETLPKPMGEAIVRFFDANHAWLTHLLEAGRVDGTLEFEGDPSEGAQAILGGLEGALLVARPYGDRARFDIAARRLLASFAPTDAMPRAGR